MKIRHKINHGWTPAVSPLRSEPVDDAYAAEVAATLRRAEKAWRAAQRKLALAERRMNHTLSPETRRDVGQLRAELGQRLAELRELEYQMQQVPGFTGPNHAGDRRAPRVIAPKGTQL